MNKLKYNKRAFGIVIFGLVCLGVSAGIFFAVDFDSLATTDNAPIGFLYCFLAVIFVAGLLLTTFRSGSIIDKQHNQLIDWWGFIVPIKTDIHRLSDYKCMQIVYERQFKSDSTTHSSKPTYVNRIYLCNDQQRVSITYYHKLKKAQLVSKKISDYLKIRKIEYIDTTVNNPKNLKEAFQYLSDVLKNDV